MKLEYEHEVSKHINNTTKICSKFYEIWCLKEKENVMNHDILNT
jgi:hypothetical protein